MKGTLVFDNNPKSYTFIRSPKWRMELNRIINNSCPTNSERLFLVCFLHDQLNWDSIAINNFIQHYNKWNTNNKHGRGKFNRDITTRQVNMICQRIDSGELGIGFSNKAYTSSYCGETQEEKTQQGIKNKFETCPMGSEVNNANNIFAPLCFNNVSNNELGTTEKEGIDIQEVKVFAKVNNGNRWYKIAEKTGQYGNFISIDSGQLLEVTMDDNSTQLGYGKADRFFSLPSETKVLQQLIEGLTQILPKQPELAKTDLPKTTKKK